MSTQFVLAISLTTAVVAHAACGGDHAPAPPREGSSSSRPSGAPPAAPAAEPPMIEVTRVVEQPLDVQLTLPGELAPFQAVAIHARVTGFVKTVAVDRGSRVQAGDVLATLEAPELATQRSEAQSKLQAAEAQLSSEQAKADADRSTYERLKAASATPGVVAGHDVVVAEKTAAASDNRVAATRQQVEAARQAVNTLRELEAYLRVTAPFGGIVTERLAHPGALVGPSGSSAASPLLRLADHTRLRLVVPVPEAYTADLTRGTPVGFTVAAYPGQTWTGTIARLSDAVDITTRTMAVELDIANRDGRLAPGTFCQVRWPIRRRKPSLFVPSGAVASTTDRSFVIRVRDGKTEWVDVKTGLTAGSLIEVFGELAAGDEVARRGTDEVRPGTSVRTREAKPAA